MARGCGEIELDGGDLLRCIRITVRMPRLLGLRMTVAGWLFQLAGRLSGADVVVVEADNDN